MPEAGADYSANNSTILTTHHVTKEKAQASTDDRV